MLLFKGPRDQILSPLQSVCGIVEKRHTLPILSNVLMEKDGERLTLLATDIEIQIRTSTQAVGSESTALTVAARKLQDILRSLPESAEVSLSFEDRRLQLKAGKSRFNLQTLPAEDFPRMAAAEGEQTKLNLSQKQFKRLLALVQYAMAQQDIRYYLNGLLLVVNGNEMRVVATDGHRLAYASETLPDSHPRMEVILPRKTVLELSRQLADNDDPLDIVIAPTQVQFRFGDIEFVSKLIDGKFPDYERVIPQGHNKCVPLSRELLLQSLQRAAILTNEKFRGVRLVLSNGSLKIISSNAEQEEAQEEIEIEYSGEALDVGFNVTYLLDVLNNLNVETIECRLADANSSALFVLPGNEHFKYVVMPMRI
ncbi:DNA polymerase III subunit beta [Denitratisoma oestradiolicum]|uniref:Beta sliding clamp n=1 Tax=Denitratisoma oestradiolicum TaxID=311182 RepID=A0A6S6Y0Z2_9PROT|nr:DNA polymerase III subunit beta [Denitratisoma oestradiolicum]TWO80727.1 DNA polymerase III subunit beta [Denitratisoma oestradiolicum]CAB1370973.1 DNA polymerase III, beta subunit [Denitratisoma oestradiolicum]